MKKILLAVEDERPLLQAIREKFTSEGFNVVTASNGQEGLEAAFKDRPNIILLDILMPEMNGIAMLDKLREDEWGKTVPVIALTNVDSEETIQQLKQKGVGEYLIKSNWPMSNIVEIVNKALEVAKVRADMEK